MSEIVLSNKQERNSSVELFRILATFLVLLVHLNGYLVGGLPSPFCFDNICSQTVGQIIIQSLCIVCVNCFLIISGFYGIKLKFKTVWNLFVLLLVSYSFCFVVNLFLGNDEFHFSSLLCLLPFSHENYFVHCYLMLCFLSPVINAFIDNINRQSLLLYVLVFLFIEFYFGCLRHNNFFGFNRGYSVIHFVLIYMLARCLSKYKNEVMTLNRFWYVLSYFVACAIVAIMYMGGVKWTWDYSNPVVIVASFCLFIPFLYTNFHLKWINWIASSTFAVFILHTCSPFFDVLRTLDVYALSHFSYPLYLLCFVGMALVTFVCSILFDKVRLLLFGGISDRLGNYINEKIVQVVNGR